MAPYKFAFVGLHIILLAHMAQSFVMLTANVEDIKKLARKFVSDSLADKIADFVAQASKTMTVSGENGVTDYTPNISGENSSYKLRNVARDREEKPERTTQLETTTVKIGRTEEKPYKKPWEKADNSISENISGEDFMKSDIIAKNIDQRLQSYHLDKQREFEEEFNMKKSKKLKPMNIEFQDHRYPEQTNNQAHSDLDSIDNSNSNQDTQPLEEKRTTSPKRNVEFEERRPPIPKKRKSKSVFKLTAFSSEEKIGRTAKDNRELSTQPKIRTSSLMGFNIALTTKKERSEFDQYDNPKFGKSDFVATSGPVQLPKVKNEKQWWEKEIPSALESWF